VQIGYQSAPYPQLSAETITPVLRGHESCIARSPRRPSRAC
jgi:hypothetical protein